MSRGQVVPPVCCRPVQGGGCPLISEPVRRRACTPPLPTAPARLSPLSVLGTGPPLCPQAQTGLCPGCLSTDQMSTWPRAQWTATGPGVKAEGGHRSTRSAPARLRPPHLTPHRPQKDVGGTTCCHPRRPEVGRGLRHTQSWSKVTSLNRRPRVRGREASPACTARQAQQVAAQPRTCRRRGRPWGCTGRPLLGPHSPCHPATRARQGLTEPGHRDRPVLDRGCRLARHALSTSHVPASTLSTGPRGSVHPVTFRTGGVLARTSRSAQPGRWGAKGRATAGSAASEASAVSVGAWHSGQRGIVHG